MVQVPRPTSSSPIAAPNAQLQQRHNHHELQTRPCKATDKDTIRIASHCAGLAAPIRPRDEEAVLIMSSPASLKDLSKAINAYIPEPTLPLPDSLTDVIAGYLDRHRKYDDAAADRLQDELFSIFDKHVKNDPNTYAAWFGIVRRLLPVLQTQERLVQWLDACEGFVEKAPQNKGMITETVAGLMDIVLLIERYQEESDGDSSSSTALDRLFRVWMDRFYPASLEGRPNSEHNEKLLREALIQFGKRRPKDFFLSLDRYFVKRQYRKAALRFFCDYVQSRPPHLHQILDSALFGHLLNCLQLDTSTTAISAALIALIMLLPHMPSSIVPHLPVLFNIYARVLFWTRDRTSSVEMPVQHTELSGSWDICVYDPDTEDTCIAHLGSYYTVLYGLYPINFMDYIRKPQRYLRHANMSDAEEIEVQPTEIRHQSEKFRRCHLLHPNFYTLTIDSEKTDFGRWIKSEAAEVAAECMSLRLASIEQPGTQSPNEAFQHGPSPSEHDSMDTDEGEPALLSGSVVGDRPSGWLTKTLSVDSSSSQRATSAVRRDSSNDRLSNRGDEKLPEDGRDSPALSTNLETSNSHTHLQDMIQSNKVIKSGLSQSLTSESVPSLALSHFEDKTAGLHVPDNGPVGTMSSSIDSTSRIALLQRQILLLQNDLSFERYQKQQHMAHIGDLRKRLVSEATSEAEMQNLILTNRGLKTRFEEAKKAEMQIRKESEKSRAMANKREHDVSNRLKNLRDESRRMQAELQTLKADLGTAREGNEKLKKLICDTEVRELKLKQDMQWSETQVGELDRLKNEISRLTLVERDAQGREQATEQALVAADAAESRVEALQTQLQSAKNDLQRMKTSHETQMATLRKEMLGVVEEHRGMTNSAMPLSVQKSLEASRAKMASMQEAYERMSRKYTACQKELYDLQAGRVSGPVRMDLGSSPDSVDETSYLSMSPQSLTVRTRPQRILSETNMSDTSSSHNAGQPPESIPGTPQPGDERGGTPVPSSPERRYFGRGGVQNSGRSRERHRDESPMGGGSTSGSKKEKKSGLRGIRGLV